MSTASIEQTVLDTLSQVLDESVDALRATPALAAHGWDSLSSLETLSQLEAELGISFDLRTFHTAHTVDDLVALTASAS